MITEDSQFEKINTVSPEKIGEAQILAYAAENAGTEFDLDEALETAGVECLVSIDEAHQ